MASVMADDSADALLRFLSELLRHLSLRFLLVTAPCKTKKTALFIERKILQNHLKERNGNCLLKIQDTWLGRARN